MKKTAVLNRNGSRCAGIVVAYTAAGAGTLAGMDHQHMYMVRTSQPMTLNVDGSVRYVADDHLGSVSEPVVLTPTDDRPYKVLEDNHVVIIRNDERYDVTGKKL